MVLDIVVLIIFLIMLLYGYKKGFIGLVAKLVSTLLAFVLAYFLSTTTGVYVQNTAFGQKLVVGIKNGVVETLNDTKEITLISTIQEKTNILNESELVNKIVDYVFIGIGFAIVFIATKLILWIAFKIIESIFELPVLKTFNKLGGVIVSVLLFVLEISIVLAILKSLSTLSFVRGVIEIIQSSVIIKPIYENNIFANLILSKLIR